MRINPDSEVASTELPNGVQRTTGTVEGTGRRFALVTSRFNQTITSRLLSGAVEALLQHGVAAGDLEVVDVPGAWEIPSACARIIERGGIDGVIALGCVIRGETPHFKYVAAEAARGLGALAISAPIPVAFGILTTDTADQALERAGSGVGNKGWEAALSALEMASLFTGLR